MVVGLNGVVLREPFPEPPGINGGSLPAKTECIIESQTLDGVPVETFTRSTLSRSKEEPGQRKAENEFLADVAFTLSRWSPEFATEELKNSGNCWRKHFRLDAGLARRVLAEIGRMIKERETFSVNPGATAVYLWRQWGGA